MLKHIVFWKIKDNEDKEKNMERMVKMLYSLDGRIKGLESIELGYNLDPASEYDVVLCTTLKSPGALKFYQNHPDHIKCKKFISTIAEKRISFDFVPEDPEFLDIEPDILDFDDEKPMEASKPVEKPIEPKPIEASKPVEKPIEPKPIEAPKPAEKPIEPKPIEAPKPAEKPIEPKPIEAPKPAEKPIEPKPIEVPKPAEKPIEPKPIEAPKPAEKPIEPKPIEAPKPAEKPIEPKPIEAPKPAEKPIEPKPIEAPKPAKESVEKKPQISVSDIQTSSADNYQSLVRPVIPGINAPIDFVPPEEPETDYSIIPEFVQKSIKEAQEDYDILESIVSDDDDQYGFETSDEPIEPIKPIEIPKPVEKPAEPKPIEIPKPVEKPAEPKPIEIPKPVEKPAEPKPIEIPKPVEKPAEPKPIEIPKPVEKPAPMPFASKPKAPEIPPIPVKPQKKSRFFGGKKTQDDTPHEIDMSNKWTCPSCGRINANYVGTCGCGTSKPLDDFGFEPENTKPQEEEIPSNAWKCPKCGLIHSNFIMDCDCGYTKPDGFTVRPIKDEKEDSRPNLNNPSELPPVAPMRASDVSSKPQKEVGTNMPKPVPMEVSTVSKDKVQDLKFGDRKPDAPKKPVRKPEPIPPKKPTPPPPPPPPAPKPEKKSFFGRKKKEEVKEEIDMSKFWKCPSCGKLNHNYVGTCGCGDTKPFEFNFGDNTEEEAFVPKSNAWKCQNCGKLNNNFVTKCNCGYENLNIEE